MDRGIKGLRSLKRTLIMDERTYRAVPVFLVCSPCFGWPGELISAIFYSEEEANSYIRNSSNPFHYIKQNIIYVDEARDSSTE